MDASAMGVILGALIGAGAGVVGQVLAARYAGRNERRRLAVEAGMREWERAVQHGGVIYPSAFFIYFNDELIRLIDREALTAENYRDLIRRSEVMRQVIDDETARRKNQGV